MTAQLDIELPALVGRKIAKPVLVHAAALLAEA
jgi:hypothetical protein